MHTEQKEKDIEHALTMIVDFSSKASVTVTAIGVNVSAVIVVKDKQLDVKNRISHL